MKVLVCIPCLLTGGTEIQTLNLVRALVEGGHEVVTACYFEHSEYMEGQYRVAGSEVVSFSENGQRIGGVKGIIFLWKHLRTLVNEYRPDVAHVQYMAPGAQPILILKLLGVKKILATTHTVADIYPNLKLIHFLQKHCVDVWTCITERAEVSFFGSSKLYDTNVNIRQHRHVTIYNALSKNYKSTSQQVNKSTSVAEVESERTIVIGVVSRLVEIKGMDLVVPTFAKVREMHHDVRLIVVGDGLLKEMMMEQSRELGCEEAIEWTGRLAQEELAAWYQKMDIVLMPSRSEGFGLTAIEAMDNGCAVVASNVGGLPEVVCDGEVGLLHRTEDVDDMAEKICRLIDNPKMMDGMTKRVKEYVERFSYERYKKLILDLYQKMVVHG